MRYSNYGIIRSNFICVHIFYSFPIRNVQQRRVLIVTGLVGRSHYITLTNRYCGGGALRSLEAGTHVDSLTRTHSEVSKDWSYPAISCDNSVQVLG